MLTVIGCGNPNRSDDGIGVHLVQRLIARFRRHPVPGVRAFDCGTAGMEVMFAARGSDALLILDASVSGSEPGSVYEVPGDELAADKPVSYTLHDFRWDHAISAGRKIYGDAFPAEVQVWLVEAASTALGTELSPKVQAAAEDVYRRLLDHVARYAAARHYHTGQLQLEVRRGTIRIPTEVVDRYFEGRDCLIILPEESTLRLLPVDPVAGGLLLKRCNAQGDRAVDAAALLRRSGWDDWGQYHCPTRWDEHLGALVLERPSQRPPVALAPQPQDS